ncbi:MAG: LuxR C-terminal-related transcriptional regulator [Ornithinimicrobium sp.]|uniref:helix-turn-helix transcriptional regulator n=1 Tax=Ornithinimicrobium sp. TaxID=1977084 RepID=UPI0026DFB5FF|nr:LuxR C-terminal-related transcriptional regulator [Ornithinimicrobium sp.]MDO5740817.1 LuxR C-terminal-related transcriptional regulator [Ornithinimicrobium sp.]
MTSAVDDADLARVWAFVERVHAAGDTDEVQAITHLGLLDLVPCDSTSFNWVAPDQVHASIHPSPGRAELDHFQPMLARRWRENPLAEHFRRTADTRPLTWGDVTDAGVWRSSSFFQEFYAPLGVWDQLGIRIPSPPGVVGGLVLNSRESFTDRDRAVLGLVGGHIAHRLHVLGEVSAVRQGLRGAGWEVISVDHNHRVMAVEGATAIAEGCRESEPLPAPLTSLLEFDPAWPVGGPLPPTEPRTLETSVGPVTAFVVRGWLGPHTVFLRVDDVHGQQPVDRATLVEQGLTPRQSEVALLLAQGQSNQRIASTLDISLGTVKKHCQQVFCALDVDNRAAAAAVLVRMIG